MATQYVPGDIRDFILKHIASVAQIEALLLIWSNPEERWSVSQIAARIYTSETETAKALDGLSADGLLVRRDGVFGLNASEENVEMIRRLQEAYARHLIPVTDVIHSKSRDPHSTAETRPASKGSMTCLRSMCVIEAGARSRRICSRLRGAARSPCFWRPCSWRSRPLPRNYTPTSR